jgi:hypothetical protein
MVTRKRLGLSLLFSFSSLSIASIALAGEARADEPDPRVHHAPPAVAKAGSTLTIEATIDSPDKIAKTTLVYARPGQAPAEVPFLRSSAGDNVQVATIPADAVVAPSLGYAIELDTTSGKHVEAFASRANMHGVALEEDESDARERTLLARIGGRRTTLATSGEYIDFGSTPGVLAPTVPGGPSTPTTVHDQYFRLEAQFTYRLLRTVAEFGFRGGIVRGSSPVPGATDRSQYDVGMNYGAPRIRLRATDWLHVEGEALTSVNEIGYSLGGGGAAILGDPYGTRLTLGFEGIKVFGVRGYTRFDVALAKRVTAGTLIEVTNMPHADAAGVRLAADVAVDVGYGFGVGLRGGYQARSFASGGPSAGATASYSF